MNSIHTETHILNRLRQHTKERKMIKNSLKIIFIGLLLTSDVSGEEKESNVPNSEVPKEWWKQSSYDYESDAWLKLFTGSVGYQTSEGNTEDNYLKIKLTAMIRKNHLSYIFGYTKRDREKAEYPDKNHEPIKIITDFYNIEHSLIYDLNKWLLVFGGYENSRNSVVLIHNKTLKYGGVGTRIIDTKSHKLNLLLGYGTQDISFSEIPLLPSGESDALFSKIDYSWYFGENVSFKTSYEHIKTDMEDRDTSVLKASLDVAINKYVSVNLAYQDEYVEAIKLVDAFTHDKAFLTSLKFSY